MAETAASSLVFAPPTWALVITMREQIDRLQARKQELEAKIEERKSWEGRALKDLARLKRALTKASLSVPELETDKPWVASQVKRRKYLWDRESIIKRDGVWCRYCGKRTTQATREIDHVIPVALGGKTEPDNLVVSCRTCNRRKGAKTCEQARMTLLPPRGESSSVRPSVC